MAVFFLIFMIFKIAIEVGARKYFEIPLDNFTMPIVVIDFIYIAIYLYFIATGKASMLPYSSFLYVGLELFPIIMKGLGRKQINCLKVQAFVF